MRTEDYQLSAALQQLITSDQAYHYRVVPSSINGSTIQFLSDNDQSDLVEEELSILLGREVQIQNENTELVDKLLFTNYRKTQNNKTEELHYNANFLEKVLHHAKAVGSSDIHFEPYEEKCRIRFRLDGKLKEQYEINIDEYPVIINRIKIKAQLDISEKRLPQDGRITMTSSDDEFDIRVSTLPTLHGEKIVLRLLSKDASAIQLEQLGFTVEELKRYKHSVKKPNGIVLISGPTGSGKTTTLYATLKLLNDSKTNILTIEDPIEYTLEGINQVQLKENIGLDFASTLRTFLRQDPDIIMVGEIRDAKTANMAIRAALTGHLVLSTIHTNSAWATVSRLIDMGVPAFLIASTLNISIAQRLVRKLCNSCKQEIALDHLEYTELSSLKNIQNQWIANGCEKCYHTGYLGRKAIYEIIPITNTLSDRIKTNELQIDDYIAENNINTLKQNAIALVKDGTTSIEEVFSILAH
ncbi:GspE/PulE family protein [Spongiivirga citrea]|uniref:Type II/IV secretion system protein n=1 Tax=Spongiivirga citrea TaxID=1481457 RepID=A0A6M0CSC4_9FLAO|nr:GspE/PulE family protein [Spongiivirga citrea]NER16770.1 type II/IV secretion system protein [Spongiivirga citrea]